ncbi:MAG: PD-(D/E)XK nuclease family transposase, partial [Kiritimatiellae bacterium]|nr:PD-(D/E)XK nuclease family transposase [Kiritimatiellia bacterium]
NLLQPVYALNFVNKNFQPDKDDYYHYYRLVHSQDSGDILEGLHLVFIELPKFKAKNLAEKKMQVLWLRFLTEIDEKAKKAPADLLDNRETCQALEIVEESAYSEAEMLAYDRYWDQVRLDKALADERDAARAELDETNAKLDAATAKLDAATAKLDAATAKLDATTAERDAAVEQLRQTARKMKSKGFSNEDIADITGLTAAEIAAL